MVKLGLEAKGLALKLGQPVWLTCLLLALALKVVQPEAMAVQGGALALALVPHAREEGFSPRGLYSGPRPGISSNCPRVWATSASIRWTASCLAVREFSPLLGQFNMVSLRHVVESGDPPHVKSHVTIHFRPGANRLVTKGNLTRCRGSVNSIHSLPFAA